MLKIRSRALIAALGISLAAAPCIAMAKLELPNDLARCQRGEGPAMLVTVNGFRKETGTLRVQAYVAAKGTWLEKGKWTTRVEAPARPNGGALQVCVPVPATGSYGIAVRHDVNGNGKTDFTVDGGGFSNNPALSIFNLGRPSHARVAVQVGPSVTPVAIRLQYM